MAGISFLELRSALDVTGDHYFLFIDWHCNVGNFKWLDDPNNFKKLRAGSCCFISSFCCYPGRRHRAYYLFFHRGNNFKRNAAVTYLHPFNSYPDMFLPGPWPLKVAKLIVCGNMSYLQSKQYNKCTFTTGFF